MIDLIVDSWPYLVAGGGAIAALLAFWHRVLEARKLHLEIGNLRAELREKDRTILVPSTQEIDDFGGRGGFRKALEERLRESRSAFQGPYNDELAQLLGMSGHEVDRLTPDTTDLESYQALIEAVKEASRRNVNQAELKQTIEELGQVAVVIAKRIPKLAALLESASPNKAMQTDDASRRP